MTVKEIGGVLKADGLAARVSNCAPFLIGVWRDEIAAA